MNTPIVTYKPINSSTATTVVVNQTGSSLNKSAISGMIQEPITAKKISMPDVMIQNTSKPQYLKFLIFFHLRPFASLFSTPL
ncbi:hypothetical protein D3C73_1278850 [compost metagenome]